MENVPQTSDAYDVQLGLLREGLASGPYPGYPKYRLDMNPAFLATTSDDRIILPDGPWAVNSHPNRKDTETTPSFAQQVAFEAERFELDSQGRPLHPWLRGMLSDDRIGVVTGKGAYWQWGPNRTVDPIVIQNGHLLLIKRGDTGNWALPGGFIDKDETSDQAGRRETLEEAGLHIGETITSKLVYCGPVADTRVTANAWAETTALLYQLPDAEILPEVHGGDDATEAAWVPLAVLEQSRQLFGSHPYLAQTALQHLT